MRYVAGIVFVIAAATACGRNPERPIAASPTSPTAAAPVEGAQTFASGVSGPMDVMFPGRGDSFQFRTALETKYQTGLNRSASSSYVDAEGEVVWMQEYMRYRANGCDHATAVTRVLSQIAGGVAGGICAAPADNTAVMFPPRSDLFELRRTLETTYQQLGRGLSASFVDSEGAAVWIPEYLRYRTNSCDHATAQANVFTQIDGRAAPPTCFVPTACIYGLGTSGVDLGAPAGSGTFEIRPLSGSCTWTAQSDASWLTVPTTSRTGTTFAEIPYSVTQNTGDGRTGRIRFAWTGGGTSFTVFQAGTPFVAGFTMTDPFRSGGAATTECHIRSTSTPCNFSAFANLPGGTYTYTWTASYFYGGQENITQTGATSTLSFSDFCGDTGASPEGTPVTLSVTLTITDNLGNTITMRSGEGNQPALTLKAFTC